jgi:hypothetical protein
VSFGNGANETRTNIIDTIIDNEKNRPRSLQTVTGCSSLGTSCQRQLAYRIAATPSTRIKSGSWLATIGTSVHAYLETIFANNPRYLTETPIVVEHDNATVPGTIDLYDKHTQTVVDFKVVGETTLAKAKRGQVSDQYLTQVNLYGLGLTQQGEPVKKVAIMFLPKNKELSDAVFVERDFNPTLARAAMSRFASIKLAVDNGAKPKDFTPTDAPCMWCDWFDPTTTNLDEGCAGVMPNLNQLKTNKHK